jgi:hypothetical protein
MSQLTSSALHIMQRQLGAITSAQLRSSGVANRARRRLLDDGVVEDVGHFVYRVRGMPLPLTARIVVLCLQHPAGFVTGPTAGGLLDVRRMPKASKIHFCMPHGARFDYPNYVELRQSTVAPPEHAVTLDNGVRIATADRLAFDLARDLSVPDLSSVVEQLLHRKDTTMEALIEMASQLCSPRRRGSDTFAKVLVRRHLGAAAESHPELLVLKGLLRNDVPVEPQEKLILPNGRNIRIDMAVPSVRWAVEVDVHPDHLGLEGSTRDKQRDRQLHLVDWQVERVTALDLLTLPTTLAELAELYRRRRVAFAA